MTELLDLVVLETAVSWLMIVAALLAIAVTPRLFGLNGFNALIYAQMTLAFNAITIVAGASSQALDGGRVAHFFVNEFAFLGVTCMAYQYVLKHRLHVLSAFDRFFSGRPAVWLTGFMSLVAVFYLIVVPTDGDSRIAYMTAWWFSPIKPFISIATPLAFLGSLVMIVRIGRRRMGLVLLLVTIGGNVLSGSKASFAFSLVTAVLALRDLSGPGRFKLHAADRWRLAALSLPIAALALARLEVTPADVANRFMLFGEATILVYFAERPTEACESLTPLARMHRGVARLLGDEGANDIDTLFGFALTKLQLGVNTFTGPNGRISPYLLCNFPGGSLFFGWFMVALYAWLLRTLVRCSLRRPVHLAVFTPYVIVSLGLASQDFNLIMADITLAILLLPTTLRFMGTQRNYKLG